MPQLPASTPAPAEGLEGRGAVTLIQIETKEDFRHRLLADELQEHEGKERAQSRCSVLGSVVAAQGRHGGWGTKPISSEGRNKP